MLLPKLAIALLLSFLLTSAPSCAKADDVTKGELALAFSQEGWREVFRDPCKADWQERWFLDGATSVVSNSDNGMKLETKDDFAVLWTKEVFAGDLRIEYDFQRLDSNDMGVNIIYIQATGDGQHGRAEDIALWSDRRRKAAMRDYFQHMHTYHISYAAFPNDYIRARRYLPEADAGLAGTMLTGEVFETGVFGIDAWVHITIVKRRNEIYAEFSGNDRQLRCHFANTDKPGIDKGRVGLRLMPGRESRFREFSIYEAASPQQAAEETSG